MEDKDKKTEIETETETETEKETLEEQEERPESLLNQSDAKKDFKDAMEEVKDNKEEIAISNEIKYQKTVNSMKSIHCITNSNIKLEMYQQAAHQFSELSGYKDSAEQVEECHRLIEATNEEIKAEIYAGAQELMKNAKNSGDYKIARDEFKKVEGYQDADSMADQCQQYSIRLGKKSARKKSVVFGIVILCFLAVVFGASTSHGKYYMANAYMAADSYNSAIKLYKKLGNYKDCKERLVKSQYLNGLKLEKDSKYKDAQKAFTAAGEYKDSQDKAVEMEKLLIRNSKAGDDVKIGKYQWEILDIVDDKAFLMKKDSMKEMAYEEQPGEITWEKSTLRNWLNSEFFNDALSPAEQKNVIVTNVENKDNETYGTHGGNPTHDYVFMLSIAEAQKYKDLFPTFKSNSWLRSPGNSPDSAAFLSANGITMDYGYIAKSLEIKVRPVIWFNLK